MALARIVVLIPCLNESAAITQVIRDFKKQLPTASIYVYDNGSTDNSIALAIAAGATVKQVPIRGKGQVIRRMFADVDADIYVMVDGDATYDAASATQAISLLTTDSLDMVVCTRKSVGDKSYPLGHVIGNKFFTKTINFLFRQQFTDIFSGYRVFSRRFVKSFPAISQGFEIETEITIHAMQLGLPTAEVEAPYQGRLAGSASKLNTIRDGLRILRTVFLLFFYVRPMALFSCLFMFFMAASLVLGVPIIIDFMHTGLVPRLPTALLSASLVLLSALSLACGIILDSVSRSRLESKRCWYLMVAAI
jgi:glycosyltransferase involved in cell wall biosynthesis